MGIVTGELGHEVTSYSVEESAGLAAYLMSLMNLNEAMATCLGEAAP